MTITAIQFGILIVNLCLTRNPNRTRCLSCREYRDVLKSSLRHLKIPEPGNTCLQVDPRTNFRYLTTLQKLEKLRSLRDRLHRSEQQVNRAKQALLSTLKSMVLS